VRLAPDAYPNRFKLGFSQSPAHRLASFRVIAPTAELVQAWPTRRDQEYEAIHVAATLGRLVSREVLDCSDLPALLRLLDGHFA
jgi:hypothetical protein